MKFHIIRSNEKVEEIMFLYDVSLDELKENNKHIKSWEKLIPGTKLKIPSITRNDDMEIIEMEPFIEDYYPTIDSIFTEDKSFEAKNESVNDTIPEVIVENKEIKEENKEIIDEDSLDDEEDDEYQDQRLRYYQYYGYNYPWYNNPYYRRY